jgi:hypothetical protein
MTLFLRNKNKETIVEVEIWAESYDNDSFVDISSSINIANYSRLLINIDDRDKQLEMIDDFESLSEIRYWLWEVYFMAVKNAKEEYNNALNEVRKTLHGIAKKYNLFVVED